MTHDEIMKMDEKELYERVFLFVLGDSQSNIENIHLNELSIKEALWLCYQAEEKIKEMGLDAVRAYGQNLCTLLDYVGYSDPPFILAHAHPIPRAQAILMTIEDTKGGKG